jgi:hypothetical protein
MKGVNLVGLCYITLSQYTVQKHEKHGDNIKVDIQEIGLKAWIGLTRLRIGEGSLKFLD